MIWKKVRDVAKEHRGLTPKTMYAAIRAGQLKAARIGAGRNVLVCDEFIDEWLLATSERRVMPMPPKRRIG